MKENGGYTIKTLLNYGWSKSCTPAAKYMAALSIGMIFESSPKLHFEMKK